jgi:putative transferase (TIGR04331 family)
LYLDLIEDSRVLFLGNDAQIRSACQVEALVGNLAIRISRLLAKSTTQMNRLGHGYALDASSFSDSIHCTLWTPGTTTDSYELLNSDEFLKFVNQLSLGRHFQLDQKVKVQRDVYEPATPNIPEPARLLWRIYLRLQKLFARKSSENTVSIVSSYLGRGPELLLTLLLGQAPSLLELRPGQMETSPPFRDSVITALPDSLKESALLLMKLLTPWSLTEGFDVTLRRAHSLGFSTRPKVVFTSNSFDTDDEFKAHLVSAMPDVTYVVGQHGNDYGVSKSEELCPELRSSDFFLTWGWRRNEGNIIQFGQIKPKIRCQVSRRIKGVTLFLRHDSPQYFYQADMFEPNEHYYNSVVKLCASLSELEIVTHLRLHTSTSSCKKKFLKKAIEKMPFVSISGDRPSLRKLLASGMGIVFGYDSTGMLEMGTAGIPFFLFAPDGLGLVRREYRANYDSLRSAGLLSEEPAQAAQLIHTWISASRGERKAQREAIQTFTKGIAHSPKNKLLALRKILKDVGKGVLPSSVVDQFR